MNLSDWPHAFQRGEDGAPTLLMLHGTGGDENDMTGLAAALHPSAGVLAPRGRVTEQGMSRWFRRIAEGVFDVDDVEVRADELAGFIHAARTEYSLSDVVAVGFSNGANMAMATAMRHPGIFTGVIAFSGMYPLGDREPSGRLSGLRVALVNGRDDELAPHDSVNWLESVLLSRDASVQRVERDGGHSIMHSDVAAAREWLTATVGP